MKVITCNLNGIRAAERKGFFLWMQQQSPDFVCVQETKAQMGSLSDGGYYPAGYTNNFANALKKGYSGVGIYSKRKPDYIVDKMGLLFADEEGRYLEAVFGKLHIISIYFPSGSSGEVRQNLKYDLMDFYYKHHLMKIKNSGHSYIICGDVNIVHKEIDIKNWRANQKSSGCLPVEREWLDKVCLDLYDAFRVKNKGANEYSWWSNRGNAWQNNVGWRIDYQLVTADLAQSITAATIYKEQRFSDHAPCIIEYDCGLAEYTE